jgi:ABC-type multidrug transport system permease subunit
MTATTRWSYWLSDTLALLSRNMLRYRRRPDVLAVLLAQPLIVLFLFRYVLGGETKLPDYVDYLMPGVFALAVVNGSAAAGIGLAEDLALGVVDRLRALPIGRSTFLAARAFMDIAKNLIIIPLVGLLGIAVGYEMAGSLGDILVAAALLLCLGLMFAWVSMAIALWSGSVDATQGAAFLLALSLSFASSGFAQVGTMPGWLQGFVKINPVTHVDDAVRTLVSGSHLSASHDVYTSLISIAVVLALVIPLALLQYARYAR